MKLDVTRQIVSDLWPLCRSGDASADSQTLVTAFLAEDDAFSAELKETDMMSQAMPEIRLSKEAELRLLEETRKQTRHKLWIQGGAIALTGFIMLSALAGVIFLVAHH